MKHDEKYSLAEMILAMCPLMMTTMATKYEAQSFIPQPDMIEKLRQETKTDAEKMKLILPPSKSDLELLGQEAIDNIAIFRFASLNMISALMKYVESWPNSVKIGMAKCVHDEPDN